jgi:hypothetical protein
MKDVHVTREKPGASVRSAVVRTPRHKGRRSLCRPGEACSVQCGAPSDLGTALPEAGGVRLEEREMTS